MKCTFIHFTTQIMPNYGKERESFSFQFCFETKNFSNNYTKQFFSEKESKQLFFKSNLLNACREGKISFTIRKKRSTQIYIQYFSIFLLNLERSNLKLPIFFLLMRWQYELKGRKMEIWKLMRLIRGPRIHPQIMI